jgi:hypothetical protein
LAGRQARKQLAAVKPSRGWRQSGAISHSGSSTNRRWCSRGCGKASVGVSHSAVIVIEQVEVERARSIGRPTDSPEISFHRKEPIEQRHPGQLARHPRYPIDEPRLLRCRHRLG